MANRSSQNIDGQYRKSSQFTNKQQEEQANEYPKKLITGKNLKCFADGDIDEVR